MSLISPNDLKSLRHALELTSERAAASIGITGRTWRSYETPMSYSSHRTIPERSLRVFCERHGLPYPPVSNDGRLLGRGCRILSITAYKGGVGKSPITVDVATELAPRGKKVAIITSDAVYRCYSLKESKLYHRFESREKLVDYYDEADVLLYPAELHDLERELADKISEDNLIDPTEINSCYSYSIAHIERKRASNFKLHSLVSGYDYVFLDLNRDIYRTLLLSDIIALVLDNRCLASIWSASHFCDDIVSLNGGRPVEQLYSLITNHAPCGEGTEYLDYIEDEVTAAEARREVIECYQHQCMVYQEARKLEVPMLSTFLTRSHSMEIARYNAKRAFWDRYCYFDSVIEFAPDSLASDEIRRLTDELLDCAFIRPRQAMYSVSRPSYTD